MKVITVGRGNENDVIIGDSCASRHHLQIIQHDDGHFSLSDFGSTNGTYINGQKISGEVVLNDMDVVRIGNTTIPWRMYFEETEQDFYEACVAEEGATEIVQRDSTGFSSQGATEVAMHGSTEVAPDVPNEVESSNSSPQQEIKTADKDNERDEILLSSTKASIILLIAMCTPIVIIMMMGLWEAIGRLIVALIFGILAMTFSKIADKKANANNVGKAIKAAKTARGFNIVQIIYGVASWISIIIIPLIA